MCKYCESDKGSRSYNKKLSDPKRYIQRLCFEFMDNTEGKVYWNHVNSHDNITEVTTPHGMLVFEDIKYCPFCGRNISQ